MMPKGVEHDLLTAVLPPKYAGVKIPMMPKGVEHHHGSTLCTTAISREDSNDAERR